MLTKLKALREEREEGFTLIELLVVILIIGILAAIAIPVFLNQRQTANDGAVKADVRNAAIAVETLLVDDTAGNSLIRANAKGTDGKQLVCILPSTATVFTCPASGANVTEVRVSTGVTLTFAGVANGYTITGVHENGKVHKPTGGTPLVYNSATGGLPK